MKVAVLGAKTVGGTLAGLVDTIAGLWFAPALGQGMGRHLGFKVSTT